MKINRQTLLFFSAIAVLVVLGLVLAGREKRSESPPPLKVENQTVFETIVSNEGGVEITVTPINLSPDSPEWSFGVSLSTHSVELEEDMVLVSELSFDSRGVVKPASWEGSQPGGHHRSGVLKFAPVSNPASDLALKIKNVGGIPEREFKWNLK